MINHGKNVTFSYPSVTVFTTMLFVDISWYDALSDDIINSKFGPLWSALIIFELTSQPDNRFKTIKVSCGVADPQCEGEN